MAGENRGGVRKDEQGARPWRLPKKGSVPSGPVMAARISAIAPETVRLRQWLQNVVKQEHVERIYMVVSGVLKVAAIGMDLFRSLLHQDPAAGFPPGCGARELGKQAADSVRRKKLTQQMCIRREIN